MKNPFLIAHRGSSFTAPENTMEAVNLAWSENADAVEVDVHSTKDNHVVVIHDPNVYRTTGTRLKISKSNLDELRELDAGSWKGKQWADAKIPTLNEVIYSVPKNKRLFIEIKSGVETLLSVKKLIEESIVLYKQITIMDFNLTVVIKAKELLPQIESVWLKEFPLLKRTKSAKNELLKSIKIAQKHNLDGLNIQNIKALDFEIISEMKRNNLKCYTWTVDDSKRATELFNFGIDGVTTNKPKKLRKQIFEQSL